MFCDTVFKYCFETVLSAIKRDPRTGMRNPTSNWDFWTLLPEALHQVTITMSPRGIPASFRHMHGFGSHTFSFINKDDKRVWVKFHFRTLQGIKNYCCPVKKDKIIYSLQI